MALTLPEALKRTSATYKDGKFSEAERLCHAVLAAKPDVFEAHQLLAVIQTRLGRRNDALSSYDRALLIRPDHFEALNNRAVLLQDLKRFDEAVASCDKALGIKPDNVIALNNRAGILSLLQRYDEALASYDKAIALDPGRADALYNRSVVLEKLKRFEVALASYEQALAVQPKHDAALRNRGTVLWELKRFEASLVSYEKALAVQPNDAATLNNRGAVLQDLKRFKDALPSYEKALAIKPDNAATLYNRGRILEQMERFEEALASYDKAMALKPDCAEILYHRSNALLRLKRFEDALTSYERTLAVEPNRTAVLWKRGTVLQRLNRFEEAMLSFETARALAPEHKGIPTGLAACALKACDWSRQEKLSGEVSRYVSEQISTIPPFLSLSYSTDQAFHLLCAKTWIREQVFGPRQPLWRGEIWHSDRIRVAYIRGQPMAYLMAELLELHDRSQFEIIMISYAPDDNSKMRARIEAGSDQFFDVTTMSDDDVARLLYDLRVDIAVDLQGHQLGARPGILAFRPAPIQVNYLGFPGTMGAEFIDYIIADPIVLPFDWLPYYAENIVHLPECYQANDRKCPIAGTHPTRAEAGLPAQGIVFCSFNNNWKITPAIFDIWMRLLHANQRSVLWLLSDNKDAERNLRMEAASRHVDPTRLVFAERTNVEDHLARHRLADLFLDTLPYNAHATAAHALWAGLPVLTCLGETFAGRVAASLLNAIGLPELVTRSLEEYEAVALRLAREPKLLGTYRNRLARNRLTYPLFDTDRFRRHLEATYRRMWERWQNGEKPKGFEVAPMCDDRGAATRDAGRAATTP
jgi:protein O-GlcNAc transferase